MVSIIIISFNTKNITSQCLASLKKHIDLNQHEVIVVDNGSTDGSAEMIARDFKFVNLIKNSQNLGFAKANNQGIKQAKGEYLLLLNSDTEFTHKQTLDELIKIIQEHPDAAAVAPRLLNSDNSAQASVFHFPTLTRAIRQYWLGQGTFFQKFIPQTTEPIPVEVAVMAAFFLPRSTIETVGILNEDYFMYFEDFDYCRRIHQAGLKIYYLPSVSIIHHHGASGAQLTTDQNQWRRLIPGSKRYHGLLMHYLITFVLWTGQKLRM